MLLLLLSVVPGCWTVDTFKSPISCTKTTVRAPLTTAVENQVHAGRCHELNGLSMKMTHPCKKRNPIEFCSSRSQYVSQLYRKGTVFLKSTRRKRTSVCNTVITVTIITCCDYLVSLVNRSLWHFVRNALSGAIRHTLVKLTPVGPRALIQYSCLSCISTGTPPIRHLGTRCVGDGRSL